MSVSITFCGGARTVTGSMHLIEANGEGVLIDCGLFQGHRDEAKEKLAEAVNRAGLRGGKVIIPAFALERTQEVVYYLEELLREKRIKPLPIYVDSPLACNITDVFLNNSASLDSQARALMEKQADPFGRGSIRYIRDVEESKRL